MSTVAGRLLLILTLSNQVLPGVTLLDRQRKKRWGPWKQKASRQLNSMSKLLWFSWLLFRWFIAMSLVLHLRGNYKQRKNVLQGGNEMHIFGNDIVESRLRSNNNRRKNGARRRKKIVLSCSTLQFLNGKSHVIKRSRDLPTFELYSNFTPHLRLHSQWSNFG